MNHPPAAAGKTEWRRWAKALDPVDAATTERVVAHLHRFLEQLGPDGAVLGYCALDDEVDVEPVLADHASALPRLGEDGTMTLHADDGRRERHRLGIEQPSAGPRLEPSDIAVVLVPGRIFDRQGFRLGRGGGHYDRLVPHLGPSTPVVGVTTEARLVDRLPREAHDRAMTHLCTEDGVFSTGSRPHAGH